jgi:hypothetical protein
VWENFEDRNSSVTKEVFKGSFGSAVHVFVISPFPTIPSPWMGEGEGGVDKMKTFWYSLPLKAKIFEAYVFFTMDSLVTS